MQSLQPDPKAQYSSVYEALRRIIRTEGLLRPLRGLNITMLGAGPAHALYFACYEHVKRTLSEVIQNGGNSHIANGAVQFCFPWNSNLHYILTTGRSGNMAQEEVNCFGSCAGSFDKLTV